MQRFRKKYDPSPTDPDDLLFPPEYIDKFIKKEKQQLSPNYYTNTSYYANTNTPYYYQQQAYQMSRWFRHNQDTTTTSQMTSPTTSQATSPTCNLENLFPSEDDDNSDVEMTTSTYPDDPLTYLLENEVCLSTEEADDWSLLLEVEYHVSDKDDLLELTEKQMMAIDMPQPIIHKILQWQDLNLEDEFTLM